MELKKYPKKELQILLKAVTTVHGYTMPVIDFNTITKWKNRLEKIIKNKR